MLYKLSRALLYTRKRRVAKRGSFFLWQREKRCRGRGGLGCARREVERGAIAEGTPRRGDPDPTFRARFWDGQKTRSHPSGSLIPRLRHDLRGRKTDTKSLPAGSGIIIPRWRHDSRDRNTRQKHPSGTRIPIVRRDSRDRKTRQNHPSGSLIPIVRRDFRDHKTRKIAPPGS